ncbi:FadR/GntR family transcriptional regulator [Sphingomonas sp. Leaf343]|uniref:FadR/GntR family transcriptional regulator n=1 Tax=Sphingomonas sp. Leaf343 TaxID=1736345 RepID=UPI0009EC0FA3
MIEAPFGRMRFGAERPKGIHSGIAHDLGIAIVSGVHLPGDVLSGEERFSADNNVSRTAYREAIRILAAKGLVYSRTKSGTRVSPRERWNMLDLDVLAWMFEAGPTPQLIRDIFELRRIVEPAAAELAAERRDERELARMGHALEEMAHHGLADPVGRAADEAFHYLILKATRNEPLMTLSTSIAAAVEWTTAFARQTPHQMRDPMPDHHAVYAALVRSDPEEARSQMAKLVRNASEDAGLSPRRA